MTATFPGGVKVFSTFHNYTDIIFAISVNELHDEIGSIERVLGVNPFRGTPYTTFAGAIQDLFTNKAPINHTHHHAALVEDTIGNDHPQYIMVNGYPGFTRPVGGQNAVHGNQLVPLKQVQSFGYQNAAQVQAMVNAALANLMAGALGGGFLAGSTATPNWRVQGGVHTACTAADGTITVNFQTPYAHCLQAFVATKIPPQGGGPCPPYAWIEAQLTLVAASPSWAKVQFSHDYGTQGGMWASFNWIAIGN
jgi:hypothetical protein